MNITQSSVQLRKLAEDHANYVISHEQYRLQRKAILDGLDKHYNGIDAPLETAQQVDTVNNVERIEDPDKTQPYFANKLGQCINFFKGSNNS